MLSRGQIINHPYFQRSQQVRREIESNAQMMKGLSDFRLQDFKRIGAGTLNLIYSLGQTESGIWVAVRKLGLCDQSTSFGNKVSFYESFGRNAIQYIEDGFTVPDFCIGVVLNGHPAHEGGKTAFLLVEDVSQGGSHAVENIPPCDTYELTPEKELTHKTAMILDLGTLGSANPRPALAGGYSTPIPRHRVSTCF